MRHSQAIILMLLLLNMTAAAQIRVKVNGRSVPISEMQVSYSLQVKVGVSLLDHAAIRAEDWHPADGAVFDNGHFKETLWLRIPLQQFGTRDTSLVAEIGNPHIDLLHCWLMKGDSVLKDFGMTGDHMPFVSRGMPVPSFAYDLGVQGATPEVELVIAADKRASKLFMPVNIVDRSLFVLEQRNSAWKTGVLLGILLILLVVNILLFMDLRQWAHCWYSIYLLLIMLYAMADSGLLFQYIYPGQPQVNDLIRPIFFSASIVPVMMFYRDLLEMNRYLPRYDRILKWLIPGFVVVFVAAFLTLGFFGQRTQGFWLDVFSVLSPGILLFFLVLSFHAVKDRVSLAYFAAVSFTGVCIFMILYSLAQNDRISYDVFMFRNAQYAGILFECFVMTVALIARFRRFKRSADRLQRELMLQQQHVFLEIAEWQSREMNKVSSFLHDSIGASLGLIRMETDYMDLNEKSREQLSEKIQHLGNDVREMSHSFSTEILQKKGLRRALTDHVDGINDRTSVHVQLEWIGDDQTSVFHNQMLIYRIAHELLQNMLKHSQATKANLQIVAGPRLVYIYMEDNGIGASQVGGGIGLRNIEKLVKLLQGRMAINTSPGNGFNISIEFNQAYYEGDPHRDTR